MDLLDSVKYEDYPVDMKLAEAYRAIFNGSPESQLVVQDLMRTCLWGQYSNDPDIQKEITISQKPIWRLKAHLNGKPTEQPQETENE
jgi:hypothetical protein